MELWHGDCLELMKDIPDKSVDCCITDPPYGTTACKWDTVIPFAPMWEQLKRIVKDNGAICLFGTEPFSSHLRLSNLKMYKYDWIWKKNQITGTMLAKKQPLRTVENICIFSLRSTHYFPIMTERSEKELKRFSYTSVSTKPTKVDGRRECQTPNRFKNKKRYPVNHLEIKSVVNRHKGPLSHPTQKPVPLLEYLIKTYTLENETVLDFTMGSGSTGVAAVNLSRDFIGIEMDQKYYNIACQRIKEAQEEKAKPKINPLF